MGGIDSSTKRMKDKEGLANSGLNEHYARDQIL